MRTHTFTTEVESLESQRATGRYNPGLEITFRPTGFKDTVTLPICAGNQDSLYLFREPGYKQETDQYILVCVNRQLGYIGAASIEYDEREASWETGSEYFTQSDEDIENCLGERGIDLAPHTIASRMMEYLY